MLPTEDEWYKAAFYDSVTGTYFTYPTSSNTAPLASPPTSIPNAANYNNAQVIPTIVGSYPNALSPYGTLDQGGNVWEWTETPYEVILQVIRGGAYDVPSSALEKSSPAVAHASIPGGWQGFRVATIVPEPTSGVLLGIGILLIRKQRVHPVRGCSRTSN